MANHALCELFHKPREEVLGRTFAEVFAQSQGEETYASLAQDDRWVLETGQSKYLPELYLNLGNGQPGRWFRNIKKPYRTVDGKQVRSTTRGRRRHGVEEGSKGRARSGPSLLELQACLMVYFC